MDGLPDPLQGNCQMGGQCLYRGGVHLHLVAENIAFEFKCPCRCDHARVVRDRPAHKMDLGDVPLRFDFPHKHFRAPNLCAGQFQFAAFQDAEEAIFPMRFEPLSLTIISLLCPLFICQGFLITARKNERFAIIKGCDSGELSAPFAGPGALEEGDEMRDVHRYFIQVIVFMWKQPTVETRSFLMQGHVHLIDHQW